MQMVFKKKNLPKKNKMQILLHLMRWLFQNLELHNVSFPLLRILLLPYQVNGKDYHKSNRNYLFLYGQSLLGNTLNLDMA
jgi:hypothetical protein